MNKQDLLSYIIDFGIENNWNYEHVPEQLRAFFTTWCFVYRIDADAKDCAEALNAIYWQTALEELIDYAEFERFMLELVV